MVVPACEPNSKELGQKDLEFQVNLTYIVSFCVKKKVVNSYSIWS